MSPIFPAEKALLNQYLTEPIIQKRLAPFGVLVADVSVVNLTASEEFTKATH